MSEHEKLRAPAHPGEVLREEFMKPLKLNQVETARILKVAAGSLNRVLQGTARVTVEMALRLARVFNTTPEFWLNLQTARDLYAAQIDPYFQRQIDALKPYPIPEMRFQERMDEVVLSRSHENHVSTITGDRPMTDAEVLDLINSKDPK